MKNTQTIRDKFRVKAASYYLSGDNIAEQLALLDEAESTIPNEVSVWEKFEYEPLDNLMDYIDDLTDMLVEAASEVKPTNHSNTINFMYFAYNFPPNWIFKVWGEDTALCNHLLAKMRGYRYSGNGTEKFFKFFMELSDGNKAKLCKWIDANYHNGDVKPSVTNEIDFDDIVTEEDGSRWTQICSEHKDLVANDGGRLSDCGSGICGVKGCINESDYYYDLNGDAKPSVTNEIDKAQLVLRWDNTSTRDDSTNFTVYHNDEQVAYGRLNNEVNLARVTMTLIFDLRFDEHDLEGYLKKAIERRTIKTV